MSLSRQSVALLGIGLVLVAAVAAGAWVLASERVTVASESRAAEASELVDRLEALGYEVSATPAAEGRGVEPREPGSTPAEPVRFETEPAPVPQMPDPARRSAAADPGPGPAAPGSTAPPGPESTAPPEPEPVTRAAPEPAPRTGPEPAGSSAPEPVETSAPASEPVEGTEGWGPPPADDYRAPEPPPMDRVLISTGDRIRVVLEEPLSSATARPGDRFDLVVEDAFHLGQGHLLAAGTPVVGVVVEVDRAQRPQKPGRLMLVAEEILVDGRWTAIEALLTADGEDVRGRGSHEEDARDIGIGAAAGTVLGAILGGKKGALAGLVLGGGGVFLATRGEDVELPSGAPLIAEIESDVWLTLPRR